MMPALNLCSRCGSVLHPQNSEGFCTRCLLEKALEQSIQGPRLAAPTRSNALLKDSNGRPSSFESGAVRSFGQYQLLEEIARGGMGVVYRARQPNLERTVALKMILSGQLASKQVIQRFRG